MTVGLLAVVAAAASPGYWWFVAAFALARPLLTATDTVGEVMAAELTGAGDRAKAVALMSAAYGIGAGVVAVIRGAAGGALGFRGVFALALVPLAAVWATRRLVVEPDRYRALADDPGHRAPALRSVPPELRGRLAVLGVVAFASALVTGPANTFVFVYAENVLDAGPALTGALVVAAGPVGLAGLVVGRVLADRVGRRPTAAGGLVALAAAGVLAYSGGLAALVVGYLAGVLVGSAYATPAITLGAELFPTSQRSSMAGWLVVAGVLGATTGLMASGRSPATGSWHRHPGGLPAQAAAGALFLLLPETGASNEDGPGTGLSGDRRRPHGPSRRAPAADRGAVVPMSRGPARPPPVRARRSR